MDTEAIITALRDKAKRFVSLDTPQDQTLGEVAADIGAGFVPGVGTALSARDFERARREGDLLGMGLSGLGMVPLVGGMARGVNKARKGAKAADATADALRGAKKTAHELRHEVAQRNAVEMLGLPPNNTAMDRAKAMGFADKEIYHATSQDFPSFDLSKAGSGTTLTKAEKAIFSSTKPSVADEFVAGPYYNSGGQVARHYGEGANIIPLKIRLQNPQGWEMAGGGYEANFVKQALKEANKSKADSVVFKNMRDPGLTTLGRGEPSTIVATLKPQTLRSRFAAFDPARINENDLLGFIDPKLAAMVAAGAAGAATVGALRKKDKPE